MKESGVKWAVFANVDCVAKNVCPIANHCSKLGYRYVGVIRTSENIHGELLIEQRKHRYGELSREVKFRPCTKRRNPKMGDPVEIKLSGQSDKPPKYVKLSF